MNPEYSRLRESKLYTLLPMDRAVLALLDAAKIWWESRRPSSYAEADHLRYPLVNMTTDAEKQLAQAVAEWVCWEG